MRKVLAISGPVGVGKNNLALSLKPLIENEGFTYIELPIAYQLKKELENSIREKYGVSSFSEERSDKKLFRHDLIDHAEGKRSQDSTYWIRKWYEEFLKRTQYIEHPCVVIPDLRHALEKSNDLHFVHESVKGFSIYMEQLDPYTGDRCVLPFREAEEANDEALKNQSFFVYRWVKCVDVKEAYQTSSDTINLEKVITRYLNE